MIAPMKKLTLIANAEYRDAVCNRLERLHCVQIEAADRNGFDAAEHERVTEELSRRVGELNSKITELEAAIRAQAVVFTKIVSKKKKIKTPEELAIVKKKGLFAVTPRIGYEELAAIQGEEFLLMEQASYLNRGFARAEAIAGEVQSLISQLSGYELYRNIGAKFSDFSETRSTILLLGTIPKSRAAAFLSLNDTVELAHFEVEDTGEKGRQVLPAVAVFHKNAEVAATKAVFETGFVKCHFTFDASASEKIEELRAEITESEQELYSINLAIAGADYVHRLKLLCDFYALEREKAKAKMNFAFTESTFVIEGYVPARKEKAVAAALNDGIEKGEFIADYSFRGPAETETPPTLLKNNKIVQPFEDIAIAYSVPNYRETDPSWSIAIFHIIFFGLIISDGGYGLLMLIGGLVIYRMMKPPKGQGLFILMIAFCGFGAVLWGALFGSWFGTNFGGLLEPIWGNPLDNPEMIMPFLGMSLGLGLVQILWGKLLMAANLIRTGRWRDAVMDVFTWFVLFFGLLLFAGSMLLQGETASLVSSIGLYVTITGVASLILTQGRSKKNIFSKLISGIGSLYSLVNYVTDILSYVRLFALSIVSCVLGFVMSLMASMTGTSFFGIIAGVLIFLVGHALSLAISLLGAYVHSMRLQYVEFFSKFYNGGGRLFAPLGDGSKFYYIEYDTAFISELKEATGTK